VRWLEWEKGLGGIRLAWRGDEVPIAWILLVGSVGLKVAMRVSA